jgi:excisionase family DNA binding protein
MTRTNKTSGPADGAAVSLDEPLLDCEAAAALLNVRVSWVRDAARLGHLPCLRVGRHLRFTRVMLEDWLAEQVAGVGDEL